MPEKRKLGRKEVVEEGNGVTVHKYLTQLQDIHRASFARLALLGTEQQ